MFQEIAQREGTFALATVIATEGSAPAQQAMKMLIDQNGRVTGTIGGGRVEATVIDAGKQVVLDATPQTLSFTLDDSMADEGGMICGGTVRILVDQIEGGAAWARDAAEMVRTGRRGALLARIGERVERELLSGADADEFLDSAVGDWESARLDGDRFIEPLIRPRCLIVGAGHVGRRVAEVARIAEFAVAIVEDREDQATRAEADGIADETVCAPLLDGFAQLEPSPDDYIVIMTRSHGLDRDCARAALQSPARYVGMLASRKKAATIREALGNEGFDPEKLHAPIGLNLGAHSAGEIAVSVVAQMIKVRRMGRGDR